MRLIDAEQKILALKQPVIHTRDVSICLQIPLAQASKLLERLTQAGRFVRLMRGRWGTTTHLDPLILPEYLTAPFPSYVSLQTALFYHGLISQIPNTIYAVSLARTHTIHTPLGTISLHHIQATLFTGYDFINTIKIATPEKALIDILYLTPARSKLFHALPEISIPTNFNSNLAKSYINLIPSKRIKSLVERRLQEILSVQ